MSWKTRTRSTVSASISRSDLGGVDAFVVEEVLEAGLGPGGLFEHLFLLQHLRGGLEALVLEEALDEFAARVFGFGFGGGAGRAGGACGT